jgi:hypothetical protein
MSTSQSSVDLLQISTSMSLPQHRPNSSNVGQLVEYSTIPENAFVQEAFPPLISPYNIYRNKGSFPFRIKSTKQLIRSKAPHAKEYVQSYKLDQCDGQFSTQEQYVTLTILPEMISSWRTAGFTHILLRAIRLVLTY